MSRHLKNTIHTIPAHLPFAATLAQWVLDKYGQDPLALSRVLILLPSRRACLSLRDAFLRESAGKPLLLPRMQPLGDVPEEWLLAAPLTAPRAPVLATAGFEFRRIFILARLIAAYRGTLAGGEHMHQAIPLATQLAALLDECERERVSLADLSGLVPSSFAEHWQVTVEFLRILWQHWPTIAAEENLISPEKARDEMLTALALQWKAAPPATPVIAAGTTGSIPATAEVLSVIASLPEGSVVLPGLDMTADKDYFAHLTESHPQWGMQQLLAKFGVEREDVQIIGSKTSERTQLLSEIMRPAETSEAWQNLALDAKRALGGMKQISCASLQEEATVVALMLREVLETEGKTAALVTHDRALARRVAAIMQRFGVTVDDSAGMPLMETPVASFLREILEVALSNAAPVQVLSLLKHPLATVEMERAECLGAARRLELMLRKAGGQWVTASADWYSALAKEAPPDVQMLLANLKRIFAPLTMVMKGADKEVAFDTLLAAHLQCAEALAGDALWEGAESGSVAAFISQLQESAGHAAPLQPFFYPMVFESLLAGKVFRPPYGMHPRLKILSPIEARLQSFDRIILGGLNEGSWPPEATVDPWFNRSMRLVIGLPSPERKLGLAAHDFCMLAGAGEVYLTRAEKTGGVPTTPASWLVKLGVLLKKWSAAQLLEDPKWRSWASSLDAPLHVVPQTAPAPTPPVSARPQQMSVTDVEKWLRDPYAIYASLILKLRPLEPLMGDPTRADFGKAAHKALERFVRDYPATLPADAYDRLLQYGRQALEPLFFSAAVEALWWPRFMRISQWVIEREGERRSGATQVLAEVEGIYRTGDFILKGRADRVEEASDGSLTIIDYKTGALPQKKDIEKGYASQLVLLALIASDGASVAHGPVAGLEYWQLQGGEDGGETRAIDAARINEYIEAAKSGLDYLVRTYNDANMPYRAASVSKRARYNDYEHLARVKEWS